MKKGSYGISPLPGNKTFGASDRKFAYLLADVPNAAIALAARQLTTLYTGPLFRLRRSSDNAETGILPDYLKYASNVSNTEAGLLLSDWRNGTLTGAVWYDQSGNNRFINQTTASNQWEFVTSTKSYLFGAILKTSSWNVGSKLNTVLYGANKQFTITITAKATPPLSGDFEAFYHIASNLDKITGISLRLIGQGSNLAKISISLGDLTSTYGIQSVNAFDSSLTHNIIVLYDGTENTSVLNRFKVLRNGVSEQMQVTSSSGPFPFDIGTPATNAAIRQTFNSIGIANMYEFIVWPRLLSSYEQQIVANSAKKAYGL
jgi:hypothetical protein